MAITLLEPREHRLLRNIEQLTRQTIAVATVPTPMDVRARRLDMTRGALRTALEEGDLDSYRVVTDALSSEFDPLDVAAAAVKLAHKTLQADAAQDEEHIPSVDLTRAREPWAKKGKGPGSFADKASGKGKFKSAASRDASASGDARPRAFERDVPAGPPHKAGAARKLTARAPAGPMVRVYVGAGRALGVRPADLVGAIANEAGVSSREIGAIEIEERFSLVEVSGEIADAAIRALRNTSLRGQRVTVRKDQPKRSTKAPGGN